MSNCRQACPYNALDGCKVKEYNAICPLTNIATTITEYRMTNADRIRAMSDEELAMMLADFEYVVAKEVCAKFGVDITTEKHDFEAAANEHLEFLQQPAEGE